MMDLVSFCAGDAVGEGKDVKAVVAELFVEALFVFFSSTVAEGEGTCVGVDSAVGDEVSFVAASSKEFEETLVTGEGDASAITAGVGVTDGV
jgi:hypothetical protein